MTESKTKTEKEETHTCPNCREAELKRVWSKKKERWFWACQNATEICGKYFSDRAGAPAKPVMKSDPDPNVLCPECNEAPMVKITGGAFGDFYSCTRREEGCKGTIDILPDGSLPRLCPHDPEHGPLRFIRDSKNGPFLSCRRYKDVGCQAKMELPKAKKSSAA